MKPKTRLVWVAVMIVMSLSYRLLMILDMSGAMAVGIGYASFVVTIFIINEVWKNP